MLVDHVRSLLYIGKRSFDELLRFLQTVEPVFQITDTVFLQVLGHTETLGYQGGTQFGN